jgi:hypothetical protein
VAFLWSLSPNFPFSSLAHLLAHEAGQQGTVKESNGKRRKEAGAMFDLAPHPSAPMKRTPTVNNFQVGPDNRGLPPPFEGDQSQYLVELTSESDPANAKFWPLKRKLRAAFVLGFDSLVASWGSSVYSSAVEPVSMIFGVSRVVAILGLILGLTLYICGFARDRWLLHR